jgi:hypothetical protein
VRCENVQAFSHEQKVKESQMRKMCGFYAYANCQACPGRGNADLSFLFGKVTVDLIHWLLAGKS